MRRKLACLFLGIMLFNYYPSWTWAADSLDSQIAAEEKRRKDLGRKIENYRKSIREMGSKVKSLLGEVDALQQSEAVAKQELSVLELQNQKLQGDIAFLGAAMSKEQERIDELSAQMRHRLVDMYKYGSSEEMNLLLASRSVFEAARAAHLLKVIAEHDGDLLAQLQARYQDMDLSRATMDLQRAQLRTQSQELQSQRETYQRTIRETNTFITKVRKEKALAERAAREAEEAQRAVGQTIATLMRRKQEAQAKGGSGGKDYLAGKGRGAMFDWPVKGTISSPFGQRVHPMFKTKSVHSGIDIAAPNGTPVKAAAAGEVLFDGWLRGYGQVVILDHGQNYTTVYAHLSSTSVEEGKTVKAGAVIGRVGKTGNATGYHLHFEVRVGSTVKNPLDYLKR